MNEDHFDVVVIGNVGIDTNVYLQTHEIDFSVEANFTENLDYVGQAGGYASRGFTQLGKKTAFIGYVGDDHHGRFILEELRKDGVDTTGVFIDPQGSSRSVNFMYQDGRRKNFYDGKGHMHLQPDLDICRDILSRARLAHFNIPNWARNLLPIARESGVTVACDLQDVISVDDPYRQDFVQFADIIFFSSANQGHPAQLIDTFLEQKPELIIVSGMGAEGCALGTSKGIQYFPAVEMDKPVVDTNGAGDGLAVGFLSSYVLDNYSLYQSILRAQITARFTCMLKASTSNLITIEKLDSFYNSLTL